MRQTQSHCQKANYQITSEENVSLQTTTTSAKILPSAQFLQTKLSSLQVPETSSDICNVQLCNFNFFFSSCDLDIV